MTSLEERQHRNTGVVSTNHDDRHHRSSTVPTTGLDDRYPSSVANKFDMERYDQR